MQRCLREYLRFCTMQDPQQCEISLHQSTLNCSPRLVELIQARRCTVVCLYELDFRPGILCIGRAVDRQIAEAVRGVSSCRARLCLAFRADGILGASGLRRLWAVHPEHQPDQSLSSKLKGPKSVSSDAHQKVAGFGQRPCPDGEPVRSPALWPHDFVPWHSS